MSKENGFPFSEICKDEKMIFNAPLNASRDQSSECTSTAPSFLSSLTHEHNSLPALLQQRRNNQFTDFDIVFHDRFFHCHKAILLLSSKAILFCVGSNESSLVIPPSVKASPEVVDLVLDSFYGCKLELSSENALEVLEVARFFDCPDLTIISENVMKDFQRSWEYTPTFPLSSLFLSMCHFLS
ncbi:hypothetical protein RCL1_002246 [Eukaryota sp. TZLM3-RCL]